MYNLLDVAVSPITFVLYALGQFAIPLLIIGLILLVVIVITLIFANKKKQAIIDKNNEMKGREDNNDWVFDWIA